jgi:hypothetical protein
LAGVLAASAEAVIGLVAMIGTSRIGIEPSTLLLDEGVENLHALRFGARIGPRTLFRDNQSKDHQQRNQHDHQQGVRQSHDYMVAVNYYYWPRIDKSIRSMPSRVT